MSNKLLMFLSPYRNNSRTNYYKSADNSSITFCGTQTSDASTLYLKNKLAKGGRSIDEVIAICTESVAEDKAAIESVKNNLSLADDNFVSIKIKDVPDEKEISRVVAEVISQINSEDSIFIDFNGGYRDAVITLVAIIRALKSQNIIDETNVEEIVYSNYQSNNTEDNPIMVYNRMRTYDVFNIVSGMDEFINFGSVTQLKKYFSGSDYASEVIRRMDSISNALKTCQYYKFCFELKTMMKALAKIPKKSDGFEALIFTMCRNYYAEFDTKDFVIDIAGMIKWCAKKGLVVQAAVFFCEEMPEYLESKEIVRFDEKLIKKLKSAGDKSAYQSPEAQILYSYTKKYPDTGHVRINKEYIPIKNSDLVLSGEAERQKEELIKQYRKIVNFRDCFAHAGDISESIEEIAEQICEIIDFFQTLANEQITE